MLRRLVSTGTLLLVAVVMTACDEGEFPTESELSPHNELASERPTLDGLTPSFAMGGWSDKVTAGGEAVAGGVVFHLSAAASSNFDGARGEIEYWRRANGGVAALSVHADVTCLYVDGARAALSGPIKTVQEDPAGQADGTTHVLAEFLEGGTGSGDEARFRLASSAPGPECGLSGSTPGTYTDGNVSIRQR